MTTILQIEGMTCQNCVRHVREAIQGVSSVMETRIDLQKGEAVIEWKDDGHSERAVLEALEKAGYPGRVLKAAADG